MIYSLIVFVSFFAYIDYDSYGDYIDIEIKKEPIKYNFKIIERSIVLIALLSFHLFFVSPNFLKNILLLITLSFQYWFFFDLTLNMLRGKRTEYIGENSKLDISLKRINIEHKTIFIIKKWLFIVSACLYFLC